MSNLLGLEQLCLDHHNIGGNFVQAAGANTWAEHDVL